MRLLGGGPDAGADGRGALAVRPALAQALWLSVFAAAYAGCAAFARLLAHGPGTSVPFWLPAGLYVGALLVTPPRRWPGIVAAAAVANAAFDLAIGTPLASIALFYLANTLQSVVAAALTRRLLGGRPRLASMRELVVMVAVCAVAVPALAACITPVAVRLVAPAPYAATAVLLWIGNAMGVLVLAPVLLTWSDGSWRGALRRPLAVQLRSLAVGIALVGAAWLIFDPDVPPRLPASPLALLVVVWAAMRFTPQGATLALLAVSVLGAWPFEGPAQGDVFAGKQLFVATLAFVGLFAMVSLGERRRALEELKESEGRYRLLFEEAHEGIAIADAVSGVLLDCNEAFLQLTGYSRAELVGRPQRSLHPAESCEAGFSRTFAEHRVTRGGRLLSDVIQTRSGALREVDISARLLELNGREVVLGFFTDRTELRRAETMAAIGSVVAGVAHQVRNPLFGISANVDALGAVVKPGEVADQLMLAVRHGVQRLDALMRNLLEFGKPHVPLLAPQPLATVIDVAIESCLPLAERAGVRLCRQGADGLVVSADRARLAQVLENLLVNAIEHSPAGASVEIRVEPLVRDDRRLVRCAILDSGPGFRPEDLARLCEPFFTRRRGGTGLGLSIARKIALEHGGRLQPSNRLEGGAAVALELPLVEDGVRSAAALTA